MINGTDTAKDMELKERQVIALEKIAECLEQIYKNFIEPLKDV